VTEATKKLSVRLSVDGADEARRRMAEFAKAGEESMGRAGQATRAFAAGLGDVGRSVNDNAPRLTRFGEVFDATEGKIKGTVRGLNDVRGAVDLLAPGAGAASEGIGRLAGTIGNLADTAGTLASIFLRNPLGLIALGLSAAAIGYLTLTERIDETAKAEEGFQKALAATAPLIEGNIDATRRLARERFEAAKADTDAAIAEQEREIERAQAARARLQGTLDRLRAAQTRNPGADLSREIAEVESSIGRLDAAAGEAAGKIEFLRRNVALASPEAQELGRSLEAVRAELAAYDQVKPAALEALRAEFARVKSVLDQGLAEGLRLTREEYDALLVTAAKRRDLGIAAALEDESLRTRAATDALFASLQEVVDREQAATSARQTAGAGIEARIDAFLREADATRAGTEALAAFRRELEEGRVRGEAFQAALQAYPDDLEAVEGSVRRVVEAWRELKSAQDAAAPAKTDVDRLRESIDGLGAGFERAGRRASRALADMLFGLNQTRFSVQQLIATIGSDIAEGILRKSVTGPLTDAIGGGLGDIFGAFFGGAADGAAFEGGRVTAFARGGVVDRPTFFPMKNGAGLMGEAGPEAILPLKRLGGGGGPLGVRAEIGGGVVVNVYDNRRDSSAAPVRTSERAGPDGRREIDILIEDRVDAAIAGGRFDPAMRSAYGARRSLKRT
jgi:hypothetical protein